MFKMLQVFLLCFLLGSANSFTVSRGVFDKNKKSSGNSSGEGDVSVSARLKNANKNLGKRPYGPMIRELDIAVGYGLNGQNADPCTADECRWPKNHDGKVYVPYRISKQYSKKEKDIIEDGLHSFARRQNSRPRTCIRFIPRTKEEDFLDIVSDDGCYSSVGRQGGPQNLSLDRDGCLYKSTVQHELLHALGFEHEQSRSDRDEHIKILWENVDPKEKDNFKKIKTNNLKTPYDYDSVMQYKSDEFSIKPGEPTMVPIPDPTVPIGMATEMNINDIRRVNLLYRC